MTSYGEHPTPRRRLNKAPEVTISFWIVTTATATAYDWSAPIEPTSWYGTLLAATINVTPSATVLEIAASRRTPSWS